MSETVQNLKNIVLKGIEAIGSKANELASSTRQKMDIMNLESRKKELISSIGERVMDLSQQGTLFPDAIEDLLNEITGIDEEINSLLNADSKDANEDAEPSEEKSSPESGTDENPEAGIDEPVAVDYAAHDDHDVPVIEVETDEKDSSEADPCPLSSSINDLFEQVPPMKKMMDKVNSSLDELGDNLMKFSGEFGKSLNDFADQMMGNDKKDPEE